MQVPSSPYTSALHPPIITRVINEIRPSLFFLFFFWAVLFVLFVFFSPIFPLWYIIFNATKGKNRGSLATDCSHCSPSLLLITIQSQWKSGATAAAKKFKPCMKHLLDPALRIKKMWIYLNTDFVHTCLTISSHTFIGVQCLNCLSLCLTYNIMIIMIITTATVTYLKEL